MQAVIATAFACWVTLGTARPARQSSVRDISVFHDTWTPYYVPLRQQKLQPSGQHPTRMNRRIVVPAKLKNIYDVYYSIDLVLGNQTISVSVDTGSSDTWVVQEPYVCVSYWAEYFGAVS